MFSIKAGDARCSSIYPDYSRFKIHLAHQARHSLTRNVDTLLAQLLVDPWDSIASFTGGERLKNLLPELHVKLSVQ